MAHHDHRRIQAVDELLEEVQPLDVEIVRRLVEQVDVVARQEQCGEADASGLAARQRRHRQVEGHVEADVVDHLHDALVEVGAAQRQPRLEGLRVVVVGTGQRIGEGVRGAIELGLGGDDTAPSGQVQAHRLAVAALVLLPQVSDVGGGG